VGGVRRKKSGGMDAERGRGRAAHSSDDERRNTRNGRVARREGHGNSHKKKSLT